MDTAKNLKSQATRIKRTVTGIRCIVASAKAQLQYHNTSLLSEHDEKVLEKAASILSRMASTISSMSTQAGVIECAKERALKKAIDEATTLFGQWPVAVSTLDKIALIVWGHAERLLRQDIARDEVPIGWGWTLDYWYRGALREIPETVAYSAVADKKLVADLMIVAATRLTKIKSNPEVALLAARWQAKLDKEALLGGRV